MNQEEDEDAFLYGDPAQTATEGRPSASSAPTTADLEMEPASEEGEVEDDEEEEEDDSVLFLPQGFLMFRTLSLLLKQNLGNGLRLHRMSFIFSLLTVDLLNHLRYD
jgi:hypothetical protein